MPANSVNVGSVWSFFFFHKVSSSKFCPHYLTTTQLISAVLPPCWGQTGQGPSFLSHLTACQNVLWGNPKVILLSTSWFFFFFFVFYVHRNNIPRLLIQVFPQVYRALNASILILAVSLPHYWCPPAGSRIVTMTTFWQPFRFSCPLPAPRSRDVSPDHNEDGEVVADRSPETRHFWLILAL